jgi:hypothetical protein
VGYDPSIVPGWTSPEVDDFGILRLEPTLLRVQPAAVVLQARADLVLAWGEVRP